jgi:transcriptional regulator with XRE-family HTH domain
MSSLLDGSVPALLAANLRRLRIARSLSLSELARATTISKATLSGIENGHANPTIETLVALAAALRVPLVELLEELPLGEVRVLPAAQRQEGARSHRLDTIAGAGDIQVAEISITAGEVRELGPLTAGTCAHVYVLSGKLLAGPVERVTELGPGDYAVFPADVPHSYEARRHPARALVLTQEGD